MKSAPLGVVFKSHFPITILIKFIAGTDNKCIEGVMFAGWGAHTDHPGAAYLTAAAAIGMTMLDLERFIKRLEKVEIVSLLLLEMLIIVIMLKVLEKACGRKTEEILTTKINELMV